MQTAYLVRKACEYSNITLAELSRRIGQSQQNLSKKLKRDTLTLSELITIADALGITFEQVFRMQDGTEIKIDTDERIECDE